MSRTAVIIRKPTPIRAGAAAGETERSPLVVAVPRYEPDGGHHQEADDYQGRGRDRGDEDLALLRARYRHGAAEDRDERRERQRDQEQEPHDHARHPRPAALGHP